jgi:hypothetical protein
MTTLKGKVSRINVTSGMVSFDPIHLTPVNPCVVPKRHAGEESTAT